MYDAEGSHDGDLCPVCGSADTVTYHYREGFSELECRRCGHRSDADDLADLQRFSGDLLERDGQLPPIPFKKIEA